MHMHNTQNKINIKEYDKRDKNDYHFTFKNTLYSYTGEIFNTVFLVMYSV
jgi:hypothetical protein